jgi:hypothetical protein
VSIRARLKRLERSRAGRVCGPGCPALRYACDDDWYGRETEPPAPCPRCGRQPFVIPVVYDPDFYGNADRLAALQDGG